MSFSKKRVQDKVEITGAFKTIQVRYSDQIIEDDKVISQTYHRVAINCGDDALASEHNVKGIADIYWTADIKKAYKDSVDAVVGK